MRDESRREDVMSASQRTGLWLLGGALLASVEYCYAHLQQVGFWPVELIASSAWRVAEAHAGSTDSAALWVAPVALIATGMAAEVTAVWSRRQSLGRRAAASSETSTGD
jgi:hypothetical protein